MMADVRFAYEMPRVSDGWIEAFDVETGRTRRVLETRDRAARAPRQRVAGRDRAPRARRRHRRRARGAGPVGNGDRARRVHGRAPAAENEMTTQTRTHRSWDMWLATALAALTAAPGGWRRPRAGGRLRPTAAGTGQPGAAPPPRPRPAPPAGQVAEEPIRCWWKTDRTAVSVGERFAVVLTCAVARGRPDHRRARTSASWTAGAIQLTPFEVVSSTRRADVVAAPWRYIQFEYGVRLLADGFFGQDVNIPAAHGHLQLPHGRRRQHRPRPELRAAGAADARAVARAARRHRHPRHLRDDVRRHRVRAGSAPRVARVASWIATAFAARAGRAGASARVAAVPQARAPGPSGR